MKEAEAIARIKDSARFPQQEHALARAFASLAEQLQRRPQSKGREAALVSLAMAYEVAGQMLESKTDGGHGGAKR